MPKITGPVTRPTSLPSREPPAPLVGVWRAKHVVVARFRTDPPATTMVVQAQVCGPLAVFESIPTDGWGWEGRWEIAHIQSGLSLCAVRSQAHAKMVASAVIKHWNDILAMVYDAGVEASLKIVQFQRFFRLRAYCFNCHMKNQFQPPSAYLLRRA